MAINLMCLQCKKTHRLDVKVCSCGYALSANRKYRVRVRLSTGKWSSKQIGNITLAQKVEAKFKVQSIESDVLNIPHKVLTLEQVWSIYLKWAKANKRSWKGDLSRWTQASRRAEDQ